MLAHAPPPPGPPWDSPLSEAAFAFVDLEMTGLSPEDHVVEICIERVVGGKCIGRICTLVRPPSRLEGAAHVHGIDAKDLERAAPFAAIADEVLQLLNGAVFVAHAAEWDQRFLNLELSRAAKPEAVVDFIDTLTIARRAFAFHTYSLDSLCKSLEIDRGEAHRAGPDVTALRAVFERATAILAPATPRDLWEVRIGEKHARALIVAKCEVAVKHGAPVQLTYRPRRRAPEDMSMVLTELRSDLDPPRVMGYQLPGRGRRELRTDRILRIEAATELSKGE